MAEKREVKVTLNVEQGSSINNAFKDIAQGTDKLKQQAGSQGGSVGAAFGSGFAKAATAAMTAGAVVNAAASIARAGYDQYSTGGQKARQLFRDIVPFGSRIQGVTDSFSGRASAFEAERLRSDKQSAMNDIAGRTQSTMLGLNPQLAENAARSSAFGGQSAITLTGMSRSTGGGELAFQQETRRLPIRREIAKAERELAAATASRMSSEQELLKIEAKGNSLKAERAKLRKALGLDTGSGVEREQITNRISAANSAIEANVALNQQAANQVFEAKKREAQGRGNLGANKAALKETQAADLEERAANMAGLQSTIGMMNPFDRARAVDANKRLISAGGDTTRLSQEDVQLALSTGGSSASKLIETAGGRTREAGQIQGLYGDTFGTGTAESQRQSAQQIRAEAEQERFKAEAGVAKEFVNAGARMAEIVAKNMLDLLNAFQSELVNKLFKSRGGNAQ